LWYFDLYTANRQEFWGLTANKLPDRQVYPVILVINGLLRKRREHQEVDMERKHRSGLSWLAVVLCMAMLMTTMPFTPAFAKSKEKTYTIKWKVNGETVKKEKVKKGEKPEKPADPADYSDGKYTYVFSGWEPKVT
jgi:hypothetical protein